MAFTNNWDEDTPVGTDLASTIDNKQRAHRLDLGERFESMFYGFNSGSAVSPENDFGCKSLRLFPQTSPTFDGNYGFFFGKTVAGKVELHYLDSANTEKQITSGGKLNIASNEAVLLTGIQTIAGAKTFSSAVVCGSTLDVTGNIDPTTYDTANGGFLDEDDMTSDSDDKIVSQQSVKAYVDTYATIYDGTQIFDANSPTSFTDLDVASLAASGVGITTARYMYHLRVEFTNGNVGVFFRENGHARDIGGGFDDSGGTTMCTIDSGNSGYITVLSDTSGIVEWDSTAAKDCNMYLLTYTRVQ